MPEVIVENFELQVRAALGADEVQLPDEVIALPLHAGKARRHLRETADYDALSDERRENYRAALVYKTALLLLPYLRAQTKRVEQSVSTKEENFEIDWDSITRQLETLFAEECAAIAETGIASGRSFFALTNGGHL